MRQRAGRRREHRVDVAAEDVGHRRDLALVRHAQHVDVRGLHDLRIGELARAAVAREVDLAGVGTRVGDQLGHGLGRQRRAGDEHEGVAADERDRREGRHRVVRRLFLEQRHLHHRRVGREEEGVAVRRGLHHLRGGDGAVGAELVLDDEGLAHRFGERLREDARHDVGRAAGGEVDDDAHRLRRVLLRKGAARKREQDGE